MKISKKVRIAGAALLATAGVAMSTAQADSLLAPLIIDTSVGTSFPFAGPVNTYLNLKVRGGAGPSVTGVPQDVLHYTWIRKGASVVDLARRGTPCTMVNNTGRVTVNDMVFQRTRGPASPNGDTVNNFTPDGIAHVDNSRTNTHGANDFVGMLVVSDLANEDVNGSSDPEGDMSGFAYIVTGNGDVIDYKLLNNHHSAEDGNFSAGFISKKVADFAWVRNTTVGSTVGTGWTVMVTGPDMAKHTGTFNSNYDATVLLSQNVHPDGTQDDPTDIAGGNAGVFNNDEGFSSYDPSLRVTCMASFTRRTLLGNDPLLLANTSNGGWMRMSIAPATRINPFTGVAIPTNHAARGAAVYRADTINGEAAMQMETSGHLAIGANHANRPY